MYTIFESGGKQFKAQLGQKVRIPFIQASVGESITLSNVLAYFDDQKTELGQPFLKNVVIVSEVIKQGKDKKIIIFKKIRREKYRRKRGHRQQYTEIKITEIKQGDR